LKVYINKQNFNSRINGKIIEETSDYLIAELNYKELLSLKLDNVFVAEINIEFY